MKLPLKVVEYRAASCVIEDADGKSVSLHEVVASVNAAQLATPEGDKPQTPRTDEAKVYYSEIVTGRDGGLYWVKADFARQLERELAVIRQEFGVMLQERNAALDAQSHGPNEARKRREILQKRITAAIKRIAAGHAPMRIPVDQTDADVVLADCGEEIRALEAELDAAPSLAAARWKDIFDMYRRMGLPDSWLYWNGAPVELRVDPKRKDNWAGKTAILVRAKLPDGSFGPVDIAELDRDSLHAWLRSRGGKNLWAENLILAMLDHPQLSSEWMR